MLTQGLYEQVINQWIRMGLDQLDARTVYVGTGPLDEADSAGALSQYVANVVKAALSGVTQGNTLQRRIDLCNQMIRLLADRAGNPLLRECLIHTDAELLLALLDKRDTTLGVASNREAFGTRPLTSIARSSLFTGAPREPSMVGELKREILTSDRIDMLVSFIKWSGLRLLMDELREFAKSRPLRIITTSYMGATDIKAVDELHRLPNTSIRVSYDTDRTRLHAKTYIFHRDTGFSTAYVGSSNLSNAALSDGLEWNVKVAAKDLPETFDKIAKTFDGYWHDTHSRNTRTHNDRSWCRPCGRKSARTGTKSDSPLTSRPTDFRKKSLRHWTPSGASTAVAATWSWPPQAPEKP